MQRQIFEKTLDLKDYIEKYVDIDKFLEYCKACDNYNKVWSCPPYDFNPEDIWKKYDKIYLYAVKFSLEDLNSEEEGRKRMHIEKNEMIDMLLAKEGDYDKALALSAGSCSICGQGNCAKETKVQCRCPEEMRYSIESLGGDVGKTLEEIFGQKLQWAKEGKLPEYYCLVGGLLYCEKAQ